MHSLLDPNPAIQGWLEDGGEWRIHTQEDAHTGKASEPVTKKDREIFEELLTEFSLG